MLINSRKVIKTNSGDIDTSTYSENREQFYQEFTGFISSYITDQFVAFVNQLNSIECDNTLKQADILRPETSQTENALLLHYMKITNINIDHFIDKSIEQTKKNQSKFNLSPTREEKNDSFST